MPSRLLSKTPVIITILPNMYLLGTTEFYLKRTSGHYAVLFSRKGRFQDGQKPPPLSVDVRYRYSVQITHLTLSFEIELEFI